jgi:hypothetical protein
MKLHELDALRRKEQVARVFETHLGHRLDFQKLTGGQAQHMLGRVRSLVSEHRASPSRHFSERNPDYLKLVMLEQALSTHIQEMDGQAMGAVVQDPKAKAVMTKAQHGQTLTPDEQATMNKIALAKEEQVTEKYQGFEKTVKAIRKGGSARDPEAVAAAIGRKKYGKERFQKAAAAGRRLGESLRLTESEIQTAQVVLAAQDMVDRIQGMMEDISEMQFKDLPALVNSIRNDMGAEQASQFQSQASAALTNLLTAVQAGKTEMEAAQGVLTGQAPVVPGQDAGMAAAAPAAPGEEEVDLSLDANLPGGEEEEEEDEVTVGLGRERR